MSALKPNENNVVSFAQAKSAGSESKSRNAASSGAPGGLLASIETQLVHGIRSLSKPAFDRIDDLLFEMADKALDVTSQEAYLSGMRDIRLKQARFEEAFAKSIHSSFEAMDTRDPTRARSAQPGEARDPEGDNELTLVAEDALEEALAHTTMADGARQRASMILSELEQRIAFLSGLEAIDGELPLGPQAIVRAIDEASEVFDIGLNIKLIFYKLFDKYVMRHLDQIYEGINKGLIGAGVLPDLKPGQTRQTMGPPAGASVPHVGTPGSGFAGPAVAGTQQQPMPGWVQGGTPMGGMGAPVGIGQAQAGTMGGGGYPNSAGYATPDLVSLLSALQGNVPMQSYAPSVVDVSPMLMQAMREQSQGMDGRLQQADEKIIQTIELLFDYILDDPSLPSRIRASLARLQIPMIKVALLDKGFFHRKNHPARRLLNEMARAGVGTSADNRQNDAVREAIDHTVQQVLDRFSDNIDLFDSLLEDFTRTTTKVEQRQKAVASREVKSIEGKERRRLAIEAVDKAIASRLAAQSVPREIHDLLNDKWRQHLLIVHLESGADSNAYQDALELTDGLIWSVTPKRTSQERQELAEKVRPLLYSVRDAMVRTLMDDTIHHSRFFKDLQRLQFDALKTLPAAPTPADAESQTAATRATAPTPPVEPPPRSDITLDSANLAEEAEAEPEAVMDPNDPYMRQARTLPEGIWMELSRKGEEAKRVKLSWRSPLSGQSLFVNNKGFKELECSAKELALLLRDGQMTVLDSRPLIDKALGALGTKTDN